ncbi:hypothetical protein NMY22_g14595 [Coprinellus aureogranulatus]|nr:hypothetical protein NMY22_g14595 [Coprinellus aureogranulatus]
MSQPSHNVDYTLVHPAPGHGKPLDWTPQADGELFIDGPLPTALLEGSVTSSMFSSYNGPRKAFLPILTVREMAMLQFMNLVTDKPDWQRKVFDDEIIAKWRAETVTPNAMDGRAMTDSMFDFCIAELQHKAKNVYSDVNAPIVVYNGNVVKSDTAVSESVKVALQEAVKVLEDVPDHQKDWHPGSNQMVLDLVHPSLFPLIYRKSRVLKVGEKVVGIEDCIARCGEGEVLELDKSEKDKPTPQQRRYRQLNMDPYSAKFQWLPCEVDISGDGAKITSYINNLHPKHTELYNLIEKIIDASIHLWERTLAPLHAADEPDFFERIECDDVEYQEEEEKEDKDDDEENDEEEEEEEDEWREKKVIQPEPKPFEAENFYLHEPLNFREYYGKRGRPLQVIVKLANIELTPEKPKYAGGSWHVEGKQNEHICATSIYYYSSSNIKSSRLGFKQFVEAESVSEFGYEQSDHGFLREYFGCHNERPGAQYVGGCGDEGGAR